AAAGPTGKTDSNLLLLRFTLASDGGAVHSGTQRLPEPRARPAQGSPGRLTFAINLLDAGSMRCTANGPVLPTHTASRVTATQSAVLPKSNLASGASSAMGRRAAARQVETHASANAAAADVKAIFELRACIGRSMDDARCARWCMLSGL